MHNDQNWLKHNITVEQKQHGISRYTSLFILSTDLSEKVFTSFYIRQKANTLSLSHTPKVKDISYCSEVFGCTKCLMYFILHSTHSFVAFVPSSKTNGKWMKCFIMKLWRNKKVFT